MWEQDDLPARYELTLRNFGKMCIDALIHDKFYFTRDEIMKVLPDNIRYVRQLLERWPKCLG